MYTFGLSPVDLPAGHGRREAIALAIERAIATGRLEPGDRLPPIRELAVALRVSGATVAAAFDSLARRGLLTGQVGRGTFVAGPPVTPRAAPSGGDGAWRRRSLSASAAALLAAWPQARDCSAGTPDPRLLPVALLADAWTAEAQALRAADLQYADPTTDPRLAAALIEDLARDGIRADEHSLVIGTSALQLLGLALRMASRRAGGSQVAVEEPGYATALDIVERTGLRPVPVPVDAEGMVPAALGEAMAAGVRIVLLTPRAQNPTGASWTPARCRALAGVLADVPAAIAIEDDHAAGIVAGGSASLLADARVEARVIHVRSFSKSVAPDLRLAAAVAAVPLRAVLAEEKAAADGWTSRFSQRVLARVLADPRLPEVRDSARREYAARRAAVVRGLSAAGGAAWVPEPPADGTNVWLRLPAGVDEATVLRECAARGLVAAPGAPFHARGGAAPALRLTVSPLLAHEAEGAGRVVAEAVAAAMRTPTMRQAV